MASRKPRTSRDEVDSNMPPRKRSSSASSCSPATPLRSRKANFPNAVQLAPSVAQKTEPIKQEYEDSSYIWHSQVPISRSQANQARLKRYEELSIFSSATGESSVSLDEFRAAAERWIHDKIFLRPSSVTHKIEPALYKSEHPVVRLLVIPIDSKQLQNVLHESAKSILSFIYQTNDLDEISKHVYVNRPQDMHITLFHLANIDPEDAPRFVGANCVDQYCGINHFMPANEDASPHLSQELQHEHTPDGQLLCLEPRLLRQSLRQVFKSKHGGIPLLFDRLVIDKNGNLLALFLSRDDGDNVDVGDGEQRYVSIDEMRSALRADFAYPPAKQTQTIIHVTLFRMVDIPQACVSSRLVSSANSAESSDKQQTCLPRLLEVHSERIRNMEVARYLPKHLWYVVEKVYSTIEGERYCIDIDSLINSE